MGLREMFALVREVHPEMSHGVLKVSFTSCMTGELVFECDLAEKPVRVVVPWETNPEAAFAEHIAKRARFLALQARSEAERSAERASSQRVTAERLEARAVELEALVPAKEDA